MMRIPTSEDLGRRLAEPANLGGAVAGRGWAGGAVAHAVAEIGQQISADDDKQSYFAARTALNRWQQRAIHDPESGAINRLGRDAEGLDTALLQSFNEARGEIAKGLTSDRQRQAFEVLAEERRGEVLGWASRHAVTQRKIYETGQYEADLETSADRAAAHAYDLPKAQAEMSVVRDRIVAWHKLQGLSEEQTQEALRTQGGKIHAAVLDTILAANDWQRAEKYLNANSSQMDPRVVLRASAAVKKVGELDRAQTAADAIVAKGLPLDQAMKHIEANFSGEAERAAKAEVASRYAYEEKARHDREQASYGAALLEVEQRGRVTPATWATLTDGHRAAVLNRQQAEARQRAAEAAGRPVKTDFGLYLDLRQQAIENPEAFVRLDLKQYVDRIGGAQLEQLVDLKAKALTPKTQREATTLTQQMNATMQALKIRKPEAKGQFLSFVQAEIDDATQANGGKPLNFDDRQAIIDRAVLQGPDPDAWLWGEKRLFELTPDQRQRFKPNAATDAPATEIEALNEALQAQGLAQTPANRLKLYQRSGGAR